MSTTATPARAGGLSGTLASSAFWQKFLTDVSGPNAPSRAVRVAEPILTPLVRPAERAYFPSAHWRRHPTGAGADQLTPVKPPARPRGWISTHQTYRPARARLRDVRGLPASFFGPPR